MRLKLRTSKHSHWELLGDGRAEGGQPLRQALVWSEASRQQPTLEGMPRVALASAFDFTGLVLSVGQPFRGEWLSEEAGGGTPGPEVSRFILGC